MTKFIIIALYCAAFITLYSGIVSASSEGWSDASIANLLFSLAISVTILAFTVIVKAADKYIKNS